MTRIHPYDGKMGQSSPCAEKHPLGRFPDLWADLELIRKKRPHFSPLRFFVWMIAIPITGGGTIWAISVLAKWLWGLV